MLAVMSGVMLGYRHGPLLNLHGQVQQAEQDLSPPMHLWHLPSQRMLEGSVYSVIACWCLESG